MLIAYAQFSSSFERLLCCCCKKKVVAIEKKSARDEWVAKNLMLDLKEIGIECSQTDIENLSFEQRLYLTQLKDSYRAYESFEYYVQSAKTKAQDYPNPIKTELINFNEKFTQLKKQLSVLKPPKQITE